MKIYLDTTIPSAYFDTRTPDRQIATRQFWASVSHPFQLCVSELVLTEIKRTPSQLKRNEILLLVDGLLLLSINEEVFRVARVLHQQGLVPENKFDDAIHLAIAAVNGADALVSWNFRHMVNFKVKRKLPVILAEEGYFRHYQIISPFEYSGA